jgi:hypothetical protein
MSQYLRNTGQLRLVLVCDQCGAECRELGKLDYETQARPLVGRPAARDHRLEEARAYAPSTAITRNAELDAARSRPMTR